MIDVYTMVLAGGLGRRLSILTEHRAKPAVPFGGKFRIIDFVLSNCANSGLTDVGLLTQYRPMSLIAHVGTGRTWDLDRTLGGMQILQPYLKAETGNWYAGTADAVYHNLTQILERDIEDVIILSGDHVYSMDYRPFIQFHRVRRFPATVAVTPVPLEEADQFGIVEANHSNVIVGFEEKPKAPRSQLASMGVYIFRRDTLIRLLQEDAEREDSAHDFGKNIFPRLIEVADVGAFPFEGYWQDIGTVAAFYEANRKLIEPAHMNRLARPSWPIRTPSVEAPPARISQTGSVASSLVANGAVVRGRVEGSVIFPGVVVEENALVRDAIVMNDCYIAHGAAVERCLLDKRVHVLKGARVGAAGNGTVNPEYADLLSTGLSLLGKDVWVGENAEVGRNVGIAGNYRVPEGHHVSDGEFLVPSAEEAEAVPTAGEA